MLYIIRDAHTNELLAITPYAIVAINIQLAMHNISKDVVVTEDKP